MLPTSRARGEDSVGGTEVGDFYVFVGAESQCVEWQGFVADGYANFGTDYGFWGFGVSQEHGAREGFGPSQTG